jgi:NAD(P)-dependent dehydrogenase (short-subunit alcohol dehydrogenase family)
VVAIVTGISSDAGRDAVRALAGRGHAVVVVYLEDQSSTEVTVEEILAAGGTAVAVRADLADELDVDRLFTEAIAAFDRVDLVVDTTAVETTPALAHEARERDVTIIGGAGRSAGELIAALDELVSRRAAPRCCAPRGDGSP